MPTYPKRIMTPKEMELALSRIAAEIVETHTKLAKTVLVGIRRRGVPLAKRLQKKISRRSGAKLPIGVLDITFYRDDLTLIDTQPVVEESHLDFDVGGKKVLLVDDVIYTGRTTRAALESVLDYGRPQTIELVVLIDRGHRELPIQPNYVGKTVETDENETVEVHIPPIDAVERVVLTSKDLLRKDKDEG